MLTRTLARLVALLAALALLLPLSAQAETRTWRDQTGDAGSWGLLDIEKVSVINTSKKVTVVARFPKEDGWLPAGGIQIWIDVDKSKSGPEYMWQVEHPGSGGFYPVKKWKTQYKDAWYTVAGEKKCGSSVRDKLDFENGLAKVVITPKKGCMGRPKRVRMAARTEAYADFPSDYDYDQWDDYATPEVDWYKGWRKTTGWTLRD